METYQINNPKWLQETIEGLSRYIDGLNGTLISPHFGTDEVEVVSPVSGELYCGCDVCLRRETVAYLIPVIVEGYKDGRIMEYK